MSNCYTPQLVGIFRRDCNSSRRQRRWRWWTRWYPRSASGNSRLERSLSEWKRGCIYSGVPSQPLHWRHNDHDGVSNHQPRGCLLDRLFRRRSKKTSKLRVTGLCVGNSSGPVDSPHKRASYAKMFPFDDVIMTRSNITCCCTHITAVTETEHKSEFEYTKYIPYLAGVFCEDFGESWPRHNGIALSIVGQNNKLFMTLFWRKSKPLLFKIQIWPSFGTYSSSAIRSRPIRITANVARVPGVGNANGTHDDQDPSQDCSYDGQHHECQDLETRKSDSSVWIQDGPFMVPCAINMTNIQLKQALQNKNKIKAC